jgi:hypothetical protein
MMRRDRNTNSAILLHDEKGPETRSRKDASVHVMCSPIRLGVAPSTVDIPVSWQASKRNQNVIFICSKLSDLMLIFFSTDED